MKRKSPEPSSRLRPDIKSEWKSSQVLKITESSLKTMKSKLEKNTLHRELKCLKGFTNKSKNINQEVLVSTEFQSTTVIQITTEEPSKTNASSSIQKRQKLLTLLLLRENWHGPTTSKTLRVLWTRTKSEETLIRLVMKSRITLLEDLQASAAADLEIDWLFLYLNSKFSHFNHLN